MMEKIWDNFAAKAKDPEKCKKEIHNLDIYSTAMFVLAIVGIIVKSNMETLCFVVSFYFAALGQMLKLYETLRDK